MKIFVCPKCLNISDDSKIEKLLIGDIPLEQSIICSVCGERFNLTIFCGIWCILNLN
ncbi:MAG: hypothetical protein ACTSQS_18465 [Promethearchaeota archaeon]